MVNSSKAKRVGHVVGKVDTDFFNTYNGLLKLKKDRMNSSRLSLPGDSISRRSTPGPRTGETPGRGRGKMEGQSSNRWDNTRFTN